MLASSGLSFIGKISSGKTNESLNKLSETLTITFIDPLKSFSGIINN